MATFEERMGGAIRAERGVRGFGLRPFAARLADFGLPMGVSSLSRVERGERDLTVRELLVIAAALDVSPDTLALPDDDALVELTDVVVEGTDKVRAWWGGRSPLLGTRRRAPRPTWPYPEDLSADRIRERRAHWRSRRPTFEQRAHDHDGVELLVGAVERLVAALGRRPKPSSQDRVAASTAAVEAVDALRRVLAAHPPSGANRLAAVAEMEAILAAAVAASETNEEGRP